MTTSSKRAKIKKLSSGRPPSSTASGKITFSSKAGRGIIRSHHQLSKALKDAQHAGDTALQARLQAEIEKKGGLKAYQDASLLGQSGVRGGDSSKVMVDWLKRRLVTSQTRLRILEVGALSTQNACSKWNRMDVTRIDLNSQDEGITEQDFMQRPLPKDDSEQFDVMSLSLVLNYVPSKEGRGDMLRRVGLFLRKPTADSALVAATLPCVFVVLPAPCILNSRYLNEDRYEDMMRHLGYSRVERKETSKLIYYLFVRDIAARNATGLFPKTEICPGKTRNNFSIVL